LIHYLLVSHVAIAVSHSVLIFDVFQLGFSTWNLIDNIHSILKIFFFTFPKVPVKVPLCVPIVLFDSESFFTPVLGNFLKSISLMILTFYFLILEHL
jgi:hypothetical protein